MTIIDLSSPFGSMSFITNPSSTLSQQAMKDVELDAHFSSLRPYHQRLIDADFLSRSVLKDQPDIEGMGSGWSGRQCGRW